MLNTHEIQVMMSILPQTRQRIRHCRRVSLCAVALLGACDRSDDDTTAGGATTSAESSTGETAGSGGPGTTAGLTGSTSG